MLKTPYVYLGSISACTATAIASSIRQQSMLAGNDESSMVLYFKSKTLNKLKQIYNQHKYSLLPASY